MWIIKNGRFELKNIVILNFLGWFERICNIFNMIPVTIHSDKASIECQTVVNERRSFEGGLAWAAKKKARRETITKENYWYD